MSKILIAICLSVFIASAEAKSSGFSGGSSSRSSSFSYRSPSSSGQSSYGFSSKSPSSMAGTSSGKQFSVAQQSSGSSGVLTNQRNAKAASMAAAGGVAAGATYNQSGTQSSSSQSASQPTVIHNDSGPSWITFAMLESLLDHGSRSSPVIINGAPSTASVVNPISTPEISLAEQARLLQEEKEKSGRESSFFGWGALLLMLALLWFGLWYFVFRKSSESAPISRYSIK